MIIIILNTILRASGITASREKDLLKRISNADSKAFEDFYDLYHGIMFRLIYSIVRQKEEAEDILQEVLHQIWTRSTFYDESKGSVYTWVSTMSRNKALDYLRSKSHKNNLKTDKDPDFFILSNIESNGLDPLEKTILNNRALILSEALSSIPDDQKLVLQIAYFEGCSQSEIAEKLGIPLGTVKTRMRQGLIKLESLLSKVMR
ncbi:MAG TPA: hypothetical protein DCE78_06685 [Bacteroidetes bacterium]|nr:hypothetical protein [Bacteroidota bacterium]